MQKNNTADIIIIGGGVVGCSTAYNLAVLAPFAFSRFERQDALPRSTAPFPWM